jgi:hypothetical protein
MTSTRETLTPVCPQVESQLKPHLSGLFSGLVRGYLPQAWCFTTEDGTATLHVDSAGNAVVLDGAPAPLDVSISWGQAQLEWAIINQGRGPRPPGSDPQVTFHTSKGRTAFGFLRSRFNL